MEPFYKILILDFIKKEKNLLILYLLLIILLYSLQNIFLSKTAANIYKNENISKNIKIIFTIIISVILLYVIKYKIEMKIIPKYTSYARTEIYQRYLEANKTSPNKIKMSNFMLHYVTIGNIIKTMFIYFFTNITKLLVINLTILIFFLIKYPTIGIMILFCLLLLSIISYLDIKKLIKLNIEKDDAYDKLNDHLQDTIFNIDNVYINNQLQKEISKNKKSLDEFTYKSKLVWESYNEYYYKFVSILSVTFLITYYYCFKKYFGQKDFITLSIILIIYFNENINFVTTFFERVTMIADFINKKNFFSECFSKDLSQLKNNMNSKLDKIKVDNINFSYDENKPIFENYSLEIKPKEKVLLMGQSGRGKTTLSKIFLKFLSTNDGEIFIGDKNIKDIDTDYLRERIIYVNQKTYLMDDSIYNNIKYGNNIDNKFINKILDDYDLSIIFNGKDLNEPVGTFGNNMSLGMQKVIMILRGLLKSSYDTIIFDEPTASLDVKTKEKIIKLIKDLTENKTVIIITHDNDLKEHFNNVINL